jgi:hypothetical protein
MWPYTDSRGQSEYLLYAIITTKLQKKLSDLSTALEYSKVISIVYIRKIKKDFTALFYFHVHTSTLHSLPNAFHGLPLL